MLGNRLSDSSFGQRSVDRTKPIQAGPQIERIARSQFSLHNSHVERHWPLYCALIVMGFGAWATHHYHSQSGILTKLMVIFFMGVFTYISCRGVRVGLNGIYRFRTAHKRSASFRLGAVLGVVYWTYCTFAAPTVLLGYEMGPQTALYDGFQRQDLVAIAQLLLEAGVYAGIGGFVLSFFWKRIFRHYKIGANAS